MTAQGSTSRRITERAKAALSKTRPGHGPAGNARRLDRGACPGLYYGFTLSMNSGESLLPNGGMKPHPLSRPEMGTIVHLSRLRVLARNVALQHGVGVRIISRVVETGVVSPRFR